MPDTRIPVAYVMRLLEHAEAAGCDIYKLQLPSGLVFDELKKLTDISAKKYGELYRLIMLATQDEWFGIFCGGRVPLGAFRLMGLTLLHCSNLGQAIIRAGEFAEVCRGMHTRYIVTKLNEQTGDDNAETAEIISTNSLNDEKYLDKISLTLSSLRSESEAYFLSLLHDTPADFVLTSMLTWHRFSEWLIDHEIPISELHLTCSPNDIKLPFAYGDINCIKYNQTANRIFYNASFLARPVVQNQESFMAFLRTAPYHLVVKDYKHISTAEKVKAILKRDVGANMPTAEQVAMLLNVSVTTLRRQLTRDGTSYQQLKDQTRLESAFHYLSCLELSNNDIAESLGFDEPSAFFRSFKKWTGQTPGEYRADIKASLSV